MTDYQILTLNPYPNTVSHNCNLTDHNRKWYEGPLPSPVNHRFCIDILFANCHSCRPSSSFNSSVITKSLAKYSSEHELVEFGIALPVLVTETLSMAVGKLLMLLMFVWSVISILHSVDLSWKCWFMHVWLFVCYIKFNCSLLSSVCC